MNASLSAQADGRIALSGELDFGSVATLLGQGLERLESGKPLLLDLSGVTHSNSAGLALLLEWLDQGRRRGVRVQFDNIPDSLLAIARISNVTELLPLGAAE